MEKQDILTWYTCSIYATIVHFGQAVNHLPRNSNSRYPPTPPHCLSPKSGRLLKLHRLATVIYTKKTHPLLLCLITFAGVYLTQTMAVLSVRCVGGGVIHLLLRALIAEITCSDESNPLCTKEHSGNAFLSSGGCGWCYLMTSPPPFFIFGVGIL